MTMAGLTNRVLGDSFGNGKRVGIMCIFFDKLEEKGCAKGIIRMGIEYGVPEEGILAQRQKQLEVSAEKAREYYEVFREQAACPLF